MKKHIRHSMPGGLGLFLSIMSVILLCGILLLVKVERIQSSQPHIIFILADDLGWNDLSYHGSPEVPTPNIDALAMSGISLHSHYVEWACSPSRGALMTGRYAMRLGLQHSVIKAGEKTFLPLNLTLLPEYLQKLGYETHIVGKWHLGFHKKAYMPTNRGFKSFFGYVTGLVDYFDYTNLNDGLLDPMDQVFFGIDLYDGTTPVRNFRGQYMTRLITEKAKERILHHDVAKPLFLFISHLATHTGANIQRLQAPPESVEKFKYINEKKRRLYAGMTSELDDAVGEVFQALHQRSMLNNSILVFLSDNGGVVNKEVDGYGTNYPLRGHKLTLWEGGVRVPAFVWSPLFKLREPRICNELIHVTDWLPTLYRVAGGDPNDLAPMDGHDQWATFNSPSTPSPRTQILHNSDPVDGVSALRKGALKLVNGGPPSGWYGPTGLEHLPGPPASMERWVFEGGSAVRDILEREGLWVVRDPEGWYEGSRVVCGQPPPASEECDPGRGPCLFNVTADPCEYVNLADMYPEEVESMMSIIRDYESQAMPPQSKRRDPRADPACHNFTFVPWMEPEYYNECDFLSGTIANP